MFLSQFDANVVLIGIWLAVFLIAIAVELFTSDLTSIWFGGGAIVSMILACFKIHWAIQLGVFLLVSIVLLVVTKPFIKKKLNSPETHTNIDSLIGAEIIITKEVTLFSPGEGKIRDVIWTCKVEKDETIPANCVAIIKEIKGNHLVVTTKG